MDLTLLKSHELKGNGYFLGLQGENKSETLNITIKDETLLNKWAYIEFKNNNNEKWSTPRLTINENKLSYELVSGILQEGKVIVQVVFRDEEGFVWKSFEREFVVGEALCVSDALPQENPDFITEAQKLLDHCEETKANMEATSKDLTARVETCEETCKGIQASEANRVTSEKERVLAETTRALNEEERIKKEAARIENETLRQSNEATRNTNEEVRLANEEVRQANETLRVQAEQSRIAFLQNELAIRDKLIYNLQLANEGKTYANVVNDVVAYSKTNPSGVLPYTMLNSVGGLTYKWNQHALDGNFTNSISYTWACDCGSIAISNNVLTYTSTSVGTNRIRYYTNQQYNFGKANDKVYVKFDFKCENGINTQAILYSSSGYNLHEFMSSSDWKTNSFIETLQGEVDSMRLSIGWVNNASLTIGDTFQVRKVMIFNLTQMYGAGKEPTKEEFEAKLGSAYFEYDPGSFRHTPITNIRSVGKNLFDISKIESNTQITIDYNNRTITTKSDYANNIWLKINDVADIKAGKTYVLTFKTTCENNFIVLSDSEGRAIFEWVNGGKHTFTQEELDNHSRVYFYGVAGESHTISNIQIEEGTVATDYEPYVEHSFAIPSEVQALEGYGLGVNSECYNYIDFKNKKFVQKVGVVDLGTLDWSKSSSTGWFSLSTPNNIKMPSSNSEIAIILCPNYETNIGYYSEDGVIGVDKTGRVWVGDYSFKEFTVEETINALKGVLLIYALETPIETDISQYINNNLIEVVEGGSITFENEHSQETPSNITYQTKI